MGRPGRAAQGGSPTASRSRASTEVPANPANENTPQPAKPTRTERAVEKLRSVIARVYRGKTVRLIDDGNAGGIGIKFSYDDPAERPPEEIKKIVKEGDDQRPGYTFNGAINKRIGSDAEANREIAIRLDAERRFEAIDEQMTYEEKVKSERAQGGGTGPGMPS